MTKELTVLNLANNKFYGEIPQSVGSFQRLLILYLNDNNFSGEFPSALMNCKYLQLLDVGGNKLIGDIPIWIGASYSNISHVILRENKFHGDIPREICLLTSIQVLDLSRNNLSGKVPKCLDNFTSLVDRNMTTEDGIFKSGIQIPGFLLASIMDISYVDHPYVSVEWKKSEVKYQKNLWLLKHIDLSSNNLVGTIPGELLHLKRLLSLNRSRNSLEGHIPQDIGLMEMLESLDLSNNNLSGTIPISVAELYFLQVLDLSYNNLSGKIPIGTQLQSFNKSTYDGNPKLCGQPLSLCREYLNAKENDEERMSLSFMQEFCISMAFGFVFGLCGVIASLVLMRSWRIAYFKFLGSVGDWMHTKIAICSVKF